MNSNDILNAVVTGVTGLGLQLNSTTVPVRKRKVPKREETVDPGTQIVICLAEKSPPPRYFSFGKVKATYFVQVVILVPNNADNLTNLDVYQDWKQQIRVLFQKPPLAGVSSVYNMDPIESSFIKRSLANENYDYVEANLQVENIEPG